MKILYRKEGLSTKDINKFNTQYLKLSVKIKTNFCDRFLILDKIEVYYTRALIKDVGKGFGITKIEDKGLIENLINKVR